MAFLTSNYTDENKAVATSGSFVNDRNSDVSIGLLMPLVNDGPEGYFGTTTVERSNMVFPSITGKETRILIYKPDVVNEKGETIEQWLETQGTREKQKYYLISSPM